MHLDLYPLPAAPGWPTGANDSGKSMRSPRAGQAQVQGLVVIYLSNKIWNPGAQTNLDTNNSVKSDSAVEEGLMRSKSVLSFTTTLLPPWQSHSNRP